MTLTAGLLLLAAPAAAQNACDLFVTQPGPGQPIPRPVDQATDRLQRWGFPTLAALCRFLPNASAWGFSRDPLALTKSFANTTVPVKYPALVTHDTWWFNDAELSRQFDDVIKEKAALKQEIDASLKECETAHGVEMRALEKAHNAEVEATSKQAQDLFRQGKYEEGAHGEDQALPLCAPRIDDDVDRQETEGS